MEIKSICFIASGYPSETYVVNAFVETLVNAITDLGVQCTVIAPQSVSNAMIRKHKLLPYKRERKTPNGNTVTVYTPKYLSASNVKLGALNTSEINLANFRRAAEKTFCSLLSEQKFDAIYGHFIFASGISANYLGKKYGIPAFFAYGENTTYTIDYLGEDKTRRLLEGVCGAIAVSSDNARVLKQKRILGEDRVAVFPNAVDTGTFCKRDKREARRALGFPEEAFIVIFVGRFLEVKGPNRLSEAITQLNDDNIYSVFLGSGPLKPTCENILFCDTVSHDKIAEYLAAADVFALPSLAEGCCNAIVEAMACGLPIISSDRPFNEDILNSENAVLIDPCSAEELNQAIAKLRDDKQLRERMGEKSLLMSQNLRIENRARGILSFMSSRMTEERNKDED